MWKLKKKKKEQLIFADQSISNCINNSNTVGRNRNNLNPVGLRSKRNVLTLTVRRNNRIAFDWPKKSYNSNWAFSKVTLFEMTVRPILQLKKHTITMSAKIFEALFSYQKIDYRSSTSPLAANSKISYFFVCSAHKKLQKTKNTLIGHKNIYIVKKFHRFSVLDFKMRRNTKKIIHCHHHHHHYHYYPQYQQ